MNYWEKRASFLESKNFQKSNDLIRLIEKEHKLAMKKIESDIDFYLSRIAMEGNLSVAEARKLLSNGELDHFRMSLGDYIEAGKGSLTEDIRSQLELASNLHHISRQQAMAIELKKHIDSLYNKYLGETTKYLATSYEESFYQSLYDLGKFEGFKSFQKLNTSEIDSIIKRPWAEDGQNFSDRIWKNQETLINSLQEELLGSAMRGDKIDRAIKNIAEKMEVSKSNASRLIRTESAFISNLAMTNAYEKGTCEKYEILATLDLKTSEICRHMDGKKFPFKDKLVGVNHPPFHPNCRTVTIPCYDDDIERRLDEKSGRLARNPKTGKTEIVENINYETWYKKYVKDNKIDNSGYNISEKGLKILIDKVNRLNIKEASKDDMIDLGEKVNEAFKINEKLGNKEELKSIFSNFRDCGNKITDDTFELGDIWDADRSEIVKEQLKKTFSYYPEEWSKIPENHNRKLFVRMSNRGYFMEGAYHPNRGYSHSLGKDMDGYLTIVTNGTRKSTPFHEIGHMVEWANPEVLRIEKEFIESRTFNESPVKLDDLFPNHGYTSDEVTLKDDFISPYIGKVYDGATEVLSIGLESIFEPGEGLVKSIENGNYVYKKITDDKEYLNLIIGLILKG
ncbi:minor capsid protein [Peptoniphilus harei]|uniref:minor capsid protein n=1 Tax=Peptoniphilus harei TaxID=54005 RepID=UPI00189A9B72|nr:minor capsid protein [Peptoniphilus harei]